MAHSVHPKAFRLQLTKDWESQGFYGKKYPQYLQEDEEIRKMLEKELKQAALESVKIERAGDQVKVTLRTARPGLVIGRGGKRVEELKKKIEQKIHEQSKVYLQIQEIKDIWASASLTGQWIAQQLEKRFPYRRAMSQAIEKASATRGVEGIRVQLAGRLNGQEIARREKLQQGRMPRQTLRAKIDYAQEEAFCTFGVIGIKVWIYKGEEFD
jgi:small subunit ribosomal protein S3